MRLLPASERTVKKTTLIYAAGLAVTAFVLQWLNYQYSMRAFATEIYVGMVAIGFAVFGIWVGFRLTQRHSSREHEVNMQAVAALGISDRELQVLQLLNNGHSNKEIAATLFVSPNTIKTHVSRLYEKLDVSRRTQAVRKAKSLNLVI